MRGWLLLALLLAIAPLALASRVSGEDVAPDSDRPLGSAATLVRLSPPGPPRASPPAAPHPSSLKELIAVRRVAAHDAAVRRNAAGRAQCEEHNALRRRSFGLLYATERATPGPAFGGLRIDGDWSQPAKGSFPIHWESELGLYATVGEGDEPVCRDTDNPQVFCPFRCTDDEEADCKDLRRRLEAAWGESADAVWRDPDHRVRAVVRLQQHANRYGPADCELRFQRYVPSREWIAMTETAQVPLGLLGQPRSKLPEMAWEEYSSDQDVDVFNWDILVTGSHIMSARIEASVRRSRIVRLEVEGELDAEGGADEIHELVRPFRGRGFSVTLTTQATTFTLSASR